MATLNRAAADALDGLEVHALTDITGFGLLGHLVEMLTGSRALALVFDIDGEFQFAFLKLHHGVFTGRRCFVRRANFLGDLSQHVGKGDLVLRHSFASPFSLACSPVRLKLRWLRILVLSGRNDKNSNRRADDRAPPTNNHKPLLLPILQNLPIAEESLPQSGVGKILHGRAGVDRQAGGRGRALAQNHEHRLHANRAECDVAR